ncbi:FAD-dependent oxidoreductase [Oceaniglobus ichthyenteri]|uniref:FAD-dependent oxidoreductase n=1 Tax=Oceaniglobus ichthyenteri TaxID=2136177 RepID=UPI000D3527DA|nr:FAD-dependent oxidoreductase [Oceaniglobus ichthyenteri]
MSKNLSAIDGQTFDVVVIGGGATGASATQNLAAQGYNTLLVDKGDFGSGTSSRSSRLLYCGLAHLSPDYPIWKFLIHPRDLFRRLWMAGLAMKCRAQLVETMPERLLAHTFFFPIYRGGQYPGWKVDLGFRALETLGRFRVSLKYRRLGVKKAAEQYGMAKLLAAREDLTSLAVYREYQYNWPERICVDTVLDAERIGAQIQNYAKVTKLEQTDGEGWKIRLEDALVPGSDATVQARMVVNSAGPWVDRVNAVSGHETRKHLVGIKGVNIVVRLPDGCEGQGLETISSIDQPFYCMPWGKYHFFGPTETVFEGDPDDARVLPEEVDFILDQANRLFPTLKLTQADVVYSWCGVRPRTSSAATDGIKALTMHEMSDEGMPGMVALTGVPIMNHRHAGSIVAGRVGQSLKPTRPATPLSHAAKLFPDNQNSPPLDPENPHVKMADLRHAARHERVRTLSDLLFRRTDIGWTPAMGLGAARRAASEVADILDWDEARINREVAQYETFVRDNFNPVPPSEKAEK